MRARIRAGLDKVRIRQLENDYRNDLEAEKKKFEALLLNILPRPIIDRLAAGETIADTFDNVTVLFSDFVGFTRLSRSQPSDQVVATLNRIFSEFDALALRLGVEKIKTIGDGYLAVAGIPIPTENHAVTCAEMAIGMLDILQRLNPSFDEPLQMRLGLASGPVVAGIIGSHNSRSTSGAIPSTWPPAMNPIASPTASTWRSKPRHCSNPPSSSNRAVSSISAVAARSRPSS
jgi:class 3 adenylate cyclase